MLSPADGEATREVAPLSAVLADAIFNSDQSTTATRTDGSERWVLSPAKRDEPTRGLREATEPKWASPLCASPLCADCIGGGRW